MLKSAEKDVRTARLADLKRSASNLLSRHTSAIRLQGIIRDSRSGALLSIQMPALSAGLVSPILNNTITRYLIQSGLQQILSVSVPSSSEHSYGLCEDRRIDCVDDTGV